uniref:Uncharacterized protein n=2 Tax=Macaca TaxID=9539 RepID=A0A5F7ZJ70_MACMU
SQHFGRTRRVDHLRSGVQYQPDQHGEVSTKESSPLHLVSTKNTKISRAWRRAPVVPATWEAEVGESLESGRQRLSELRSRHCTAAWATERDSCLKKEKKAVARACHPSTLGG